MAKISTDIIIRINILANFRQVENISVIVFMVMDLMARMREATAITPIGEAMEVTDTTVIMVLMDKVMVQVTQVLMAHILGAMDGMELAIVQTTLMDIKHKHGTVPVVMKEGNGGVISEKINLKV